MTVRQSTKKAFYTIIAVVGSVVFLISTPIWLYTISKPPKVDKCDVDSTGTTIPDRRADGLLSQTGNLYFLRRDGMPDIPVGNCDVNLCTGPTDKMNGHIGEPAYAEFCGSTVTRLMLSGKEVFNHPPELIQHIDPKEFVVNVSSSIAMVVSCIVGWFGIARLISARKRTIRD